MSEKKDFVLDTNQIAKILPHRYPFLLVDKVLSVNLEEGTIVAIKNVTRNEEFFQGHFPTMPIMPGVLILEALAQTGGILVHQKGFDHHIALLMSVDKAKFRKPVVPGDVLMLHAKAKMITSKGGKVYAQALVNGKVVAEAEVGFALIAKDQ